MDNVNLGTFCFYSLALLLWFCNVVSVLYWALFGFDVNDGGLVNWCRAGVMFNWIFMENLLLRLWLALYFFDLALYYAFHYQCTATNGG